MDNNDAFRYEIKKEKRKHSPFTDGCFATAATTLGAANHKKERRMRNCWCVQI